MKENNYEKLERITDCPNCGMLVYSNAVVCPECNISLVFEVPKNFESYDIEKMFSHLQVHIAYLENFIHKKSNTIYPFDYNGAFTKLLDETLNNRTIGNENKLIKVFDYFEGLNRYLNENEIDWEYLKKNEIFNKSLFDITIIANRNNCLRPIIYPNDEDLDVSDYYEWKEEYNSFKSFESIKEGGDDESYDFEIVEKESKFKAELEKYDFFSLEKVNVLNKKQQNELIAIIHNKKISYIIAWFEYLGFLKYFRSSFSKSNLDRNKKLAVLLKTNDREIRGNINSFITSSNDRKRYKSFTFLEQIQQEYETLKN